MSSLKGKVAFITGGCGGIGKEIAIAFLKKEMKVCLADVANGEKVVQELQREYGQDQVCFQNCNVTNEKDFEAAVVKAKSHFGHLDVLINNAGIGGESNWRRMIEINVCGVICGTLLALKHIVNAKGGKEGTMIINTSSLAGIYSTASMPSYVASKHAVVGLTKSWADEENFAETGVKVNAVLPVATDTPLIPDLAGDTVNKKSVTQLLSSLKPLLLNPATVAQAYVRLLEEDANGKLLVVDYDGMRYEPYKIHGKD